MSKKPISPLRQRSTDDMTARRFSEDTKRDGMVRLVENQQRARPEVADLDEGASLEWT